MSKKEKSKESHVWSYNNIDRTPDKLRGVYAFWCKGKCIYVGKAKEQPIKKRLRDHWLGSHNRKLSLWIKAFGKYLDICYISIEINKIDRLERRLIKTWRPETNIQYNQ